MVLRLTQVALLTFLCASLILFGIIVQSEHGWGSVTHFRLSHLFKVKAPFTPSPRATTVSTEKAGLAHYVWKQCGNPDAEMTSSAALKSSPFSHVLVNDKNKMLYCIVAKVACSNWRRVLLALSGKVNATNPTDINIHAVHHQYKSLLPLLRSFTRPESEHRLSNYYKFMFVRNPLERLLSAWRNKFQTNMSTSVSFRRYFVQVIVRQYRNDSQQLDKKSLDSVQIRFDEFLRFVVDQAEKGAVLNDHWERFHKLCHPCTVRYDFVGRYEHLEEDAMRVLKSVHADRMVRFPERSAVYKHSRTTEVMREFYKDIPASLLKRVYRCYQEDFQLFNYSVPDFLKLENNK
ncbi:carbohydrate sulfotransferase 11-like isoform X2 [Littorina saxatilis]